MRTMRPVLAALILVLVAVPDNIAPSLHVSATGDADATCRADGNGACADAPGRPPMPRISTGDGSDDDATNDGTFAVGVKTCGHYHATRTRAAYEAWARHVPHRLFASDARNADDPRVDADTIVFADIPRAAPYEPPWARDDYNPETDE